ncbi:E3 ubiquitin-protein ligase RNF14 [Bagarius yarrelli]|uniref:RBR-type E3 ubiquitin transferase n=1 Tax=Bagarius yarrelli TaxID=175774 RepID=A0A556VVI1_BAGYA|nr:E3 ubiquitin-protein ligase RNF14 [Bagarius yarrelli]
MSQDLEAQDDELLALASIYDEEEFHRAESGREGEIQLRLELPQDFKLLVSGKEKSRVPVSCSGYVPESGVTLSILCKCLDELWEENQGSVVLFTWIQFLKEEALDFLGLQSPLEIPANGSKRSQLESSKTDGACNRVESVCAEKKKLSELDLRAVQEAEPHADLLRQLLDFDEAQRQKVFDSKLFCCGICFSEKLGSACTQFKECQHVYCRDCVRKFFQIQIRDGQVHCLTCPEPECTSVATPSQVKLLVGEDEFARYDRLLLQNSLDLMADVVYCPRTSCCTAVMLEPNATMGQCPSCRYAFCTLCKRAYHGVSHCKPTVQELHKLQEEYLSGSEEVRAFLEQRFGKQVMQRALDESSSMKWLEENSKNCPRCGCHIQVSSTKGPLDRTKQTFTCTPVQTVLTCSPAVHKTSPSHRSPVHNPFTGPFTRSPVHPFTRSPVHPFTRSHALLFTCSPALLFRKMTIIFWSSPFSCRWCL